MPYECDSGDGQEPVILITALNGSGDSVVWCAECLPKWVDTMHQAFFDAPPAAVHAATEPAGDDDTDDDDQVDEQAQPGPAPDPEPAPAEPEPASEPEPEPAEASA